MLGAIEKRIRLLGLDRVSAGHEAPGKVVDSGSLREHVLEEREGKMRGYLDAHAGGNCGSSGPDVS